jgi:putative ABC transport system permease protein
MIKHLFKLIWNRKRKTLLLTIEILVSFLVLFVIFSIFTDNYAKYLEPIGFEYTNLWNVSISSSPKEDSLSAVNGYLNIWESLKKFPEIEEFCFSDNAPYVNSMMMNGFKSELGVKSAALIYSGTERMAEVLKLRIIEGRWFNESDDAGIKPPIVITKSLRDKFFSKNEDAIGKTIMEDRRSDKGKEYRVIGVVEDYRYMGEFDINYSNIPFRGMFFNISKKNPNPSATELPSTSLLIKVRPGTGVEFEEKILKHIKDLTGGWTANIYSIEESRDKYIKSKILTIAIPAAISLFLIINVALGLLGVLWYSINRRHGEIGLRRAVGASGIAIAKQIVGESLVLGTISILIGIIFAAQFPILKIFDIVILYYLIGLLGAAAFLYLLISICSLYPSILASKVEPAEALHNE